MALVQQSAELVVSAGLDDDEGVVVFPANTTAGNLVVLVCWNTSSTGTAFASTGFSTDVSQQGGSGNGAAVAILSQANVAGGTTTYTVTLPSGGNWRVKGYEFSGVATSSHVEAFENNANDTTNDPTAAPAGSIDTTVGGPIVVGYILDRTLASITGPTGFTGFTGTANSVNLYQGYSAFKVATGASTDERGAVNVSAGANYEAVIVAYRGTGGGSGATATGATLTAAASLIAGSASGPAGTLNFQAAGMEFGARTGLGIDTFALDASANYRYTVHADALVLGTPIFTSGVVATDSAGKLPNATNAAFITGQTVWVCAVRQADGQRAVFPMVVA